MVLARFLVVRWKFSYIMGSVMSLLNKDKCMSHIGDSNMPCSYFAGMYTAELE